MRPPWRERWRAWKPRDVETSWSDTPCGAARAIPGPSIFTTQDGMLIERRQRGGQCTHPRAVFAEFSALGGRKGWLAWNRLWRLRGVADRLIGGVGFRRGRRPPD